MRKCTRCGEIKPEAEFHRQGKRNGKQRRRSDCRDCCNAAQRTPHGKQARRERTRRWAERNPRYQKDWYQRNRARVLAKVHAYQEADPARYRRQQVESRARHPKTQVRIQAGYRARKRGAFIEDVDPAVVYQMHGGMCGICKEFINDDFEVDHVVPLGREGVHGYVNVQPAHMRCNRVKHDHLETELSDELRASLRETVYADSRDG
jgi:5-methylcytosine-specific restriction endonuclease McrA